MEENRSTQIQTAMPRWRTSAIDGLVVERVLGHELRV
jgi:hypothetical protein